MFVKYLPHLLALMLPLIPACAYPAIEIEPRYWFPGFELEALIEEDDIGTKIDFDEDLGMDDENFAGGRIKLFTGDDSWIRIDYVPIEYDGDDVLKRRIDFNGETYTVGSRVLSEFNLEYGRFGWGWQFINIDDCVKLGTLLEAKIFNLETQIATANGLIDEKEDFLFGLPTVGAILDIDPIDEINIFAELSGIKAGSYGYMYDAEAGVKIIPIDNVTVTGGYRIVKFNIEAGDNEAMMQLNGPFVGVSVRF